jgi:3-phenylpropionate/trans-cinnamate dioxygenase ferredoxin reductase subunit
MISKIPFYDVVIVGAGHAGAQTAVALRQQAFAGSIALMGDECELPYERPPLSKDYFSGEKSFERILIRPEAYWGERAINLMLGRRVVSVCPEAHTVTTKRGETIGYGKLVWATGGSPRQLACGGRDLPNVCYVKTRADVDGMRSQLSELHNIVIIGGGYIGLEAAAVLSKLGKKVVVLEALDRVLARVAGPTLSRFFEAEHRAHGVDIRLGIKVKALVGSGQPYGDGRDKICGVETEGSGTVPADIVIVGIGIVPAVEPLLAAGAEGANGVDVDENCCTTLADVYAVGDCAAHINSFAGGQRIRLESVQNANDQATTVAKVIAGKTTSHNNVPWFWSNQYDLRLQTVGLSSGHDDTIIRGEPSTRSFSIIYLREGKVIALDCVNATKDYVQGFALIREQLSIPSAQLANPAIDLKDAARSSSLRVSA